MTVEEAVAFAIKHSPAVSDVTVGTLLDLYVQHRIREVEISERYLATLRSYEKTIRAAMGATLIQDVTKQDIRRFLASLTSRDGSKPASTATRNHYLETFRALFNFAKEERLIAMSPTDGIKAAKSDGEPVHVLSVEQVAKLLEVLASPEHSEVAPAALIQLFAGPRRSELPYIKWEFIAGEYLRLDKVKRGTKKRPVQMPDALIEWLAPVSQKTGYVFAPKELTQDRDGHGIADPAERKRATQLAARACEDGYTWRLNKAAVAAGITIPKNALRHTAITMRANEKGDIPATARWAGNSAAVVCTNYLGAGTPDDAKRFYALRPVAGKVVSITTQQSTPATAPATAAKVAV